MYSTLERLLPWLVRAAWGVLPFTVGPVLAAALDDRSRPVQIVASVALWGVWALVLLATLAPHPLGLTALRSAAPAALVAAGVAAGGGHGSSLPMAISLATAGLATVVVFLPETGALFVNGPAYPNERRLPLRVPGPLVVGIVPGAWALAVGAPAAGLLLLAAGQWVPGAIVLALGIPVAAALYRSLHALSRRWVVFVPAGMVLHDPLALTDPVLFHRQEIEALRPAPAGSESLDLSQGAPGLALELVLREEATLMLAQPRNRPGRSVTVDRLLFTPTRPGAVLREAGARRVPTG
ncbi:MAG: hypothetical protein M3396_00235 [Actinomycetota bacterium]|nr:hypothetical protein [Actinomycetota bacterium]